MCVSQRRNYNDLLSQPPSKIPWYTNNLVQFHTAYARVCLYVLFTKFFQVKVKVSFFHNVFIELMMRDPAISDYYIYNVSLSGLPTETAQVVICTLVCCHSN